MARATRWDTSQNDQQWTFQNIPRLAVEFVICSDSGLRLARRVGETSNGLRSHSGQDAGNCSEAPRQIPDKMHDE